MNHIDNASLKLAKKILTGASEMALATLRSDGAPHVTTVSFASDGMTIYAAIALDSHKAHDINREPRVSVAVYLPGVSWDQSQGMSIDAEAEWLRDPAELALASALLLDKLPAYRTIIDEPDIHPWPGMLFIRVKPRSIMLLDYKKKFGYSELFELEN